MQLVSLLLAIEEFMATIHLNSKSAPTVLQVVVLLHAFFEFQVQLIRVPAVLDAY